MCYTGFEMAERTMASRGGARVFWLLSGGVAMGFAFWGALYVGVLAFSLPVPIYYHFPTLALGLVASTIATAIGLFVAIQKHTGLAPLFLASIPLGAATASVPFLDVAAIRAPATIEYRWGSVALSVVFAMVFFLFVLVLVLRILRVQRPEVPRKIAGSMILGCAVSMLSPLALYAARFHPSTALVDLTHTVGRSSLGVAATAGTALLICVGAVVTSVLDGLLQSQVAVVEKARETEGFFRSLAEAIPGIIWTARPDGAIDYASERWYSYAGTSPQPDKELAWRTAVHPDDVAVCLARWEQSIRTGEAYEIEYRLRRGSDGSYRWFLARAAAVRDDQGNIIKWFGTVTDIEDQKHSQQILEDQIRERTEQLAEVNTKLQEEMWERDLARKELDQQNERILHELSERSRRATMLTKMGEHLQSCLSRDEVFAAALGFAPKIFIHPGAIALLDSEGNLAEVIGSWGNCELPRKAFETNACWALRTGHKHLVPAGDGTAPCAHASGLTHTYLCVPILAQGEALGIMHFQGTDEHPNMGEAELSFKTTFAGQVGLSIANINLRDALRSQSIKDTLTGLYNRRYMEEMLDREIRRAVRTHRPLGILMLDLDHFKTFNDTYGHDAGDSVLREAAAFVAKSVRSEDTLCRYGGEEFVVILPTATLEGAQIRAEAIRSKLRELTVLHQGQTLGTITVSIGVSAFPNHGASPRELLAAADAALYTAKREGRDRVAVAEPRSSAASAGAAQS